MNPLDIIICIFDKIVKIVSNSPRTYVHSRDRRHAPKYLKKREIVKNVWAGTLIIFLIMLQFNHAYLLAVIVGISVLITFVSFMILDETK